MKKKLLLLVLLTTCYQYAQSLPIFLDGRFDDWNTGVPTYIDTRNDGNVSDFKSFSVTNDEQFLFIKLVVTPIFKLVEDNNISIYIDGDNNHNTGYQINGIGAELRFDFGQRNGFNYNTNTPVKHSDIHFRSLPTVTDSIFEIAIGRQFIPPSNGTGTIRIFFIDNSSGGDWMPNQGETFEYTFDDTPTPPVETIDINRQDSLYLRIINWNVYNDGIVDPQRQQYYQRILQAIEPDIIGFNEVFQSTAAQVRNAINQMLPLPNGASWQAAKLDQGNVIVSKYPFIQNWLVYPGQRITASLIDLPERFGSDILVINCHYKCCGGAANDATRQREADATVSFILDAKTPGGVIDLPAETPFVIIGDLNLVGDRQQLITLLTGEIINTNLFGQGGNPDWDDSDLMDVISQQTDKRTAYSWRNDQSTFPPGRLDFQIYSNSVINIEKNFILQTEVMSADRLNKYGLQQFDTRDASDHFPKVVDVSFNLTTDAKDEAHLPGNFLYQNYPNPFNPSTIISWQSPFFSHQALRIYDLLGSEVATLVDEERQAGFHQIEFDGHSLPSGIYFYRLQTGEFTATKKLLLLK